MLKRWVGLALLATGLVFFPGSAWFLVVDHPQRADVIVVLAGETERRPEKGLELLSAGYAPTLLLDVPVARIYDQNAVDLAKNYLRSAAGSQSAKVCPVDGLSTKAEVEDVRKCLQGSGSHQVLIVTSDYHTRRALSIFRHQDRDRQYSVAAAFDEREFGSQWWRHREWAKINVAEWTRLVWWELADRWY